MHQHSAELGVVAVRDLACCAPVVLPLLAAPRAARRAGEARETQPLVNVAASLLAAAALTLLAYAVTRPLVRLWRPRRPRMPCPVALAVVLIGFFALVTRRRALSQVVGFLLLDNGITATAFLTTAGVPLIVELGVSFDLLLVVAGAAGAHHPAARRLRQHRPGRAAGAARLMTTSCCSPRSRCRALAALGVRRRWAGGRAHRLARRRRRAPGGSAAAIALAAAVTAVTGRAPRSAGCCARTRCRPACCIVIGAVAAAGDGGQSRLPGRRVRRRARRRPRRAALRDPRPACSSPPWPPPCWPATSACSGSPIEATTIVTAFLVGHQRTRTASGGRLEIRGDLLGRRSRIAFLGLVLLYYAALHAGLSAAARAGLGHADGQRRTPWTRRVTRIAIGLLVLGFGAKAGLVPLHAWLPDAHTQAPAPVSALMSGVLLSVAFYAVLRVKAIADAALGAGFPARCC